jgi:protocatechuate 3,4-dioxygenase beta subunit
MFIRTTIGFLLAVVVLLATGAGLSAAAGSACPATNPPNTLALAGGSGQTAQLGRQFQGTLQVALANTDGCPLTGNLAGISVDFVAPGGGASGIFASTGTGAAVVGTDAQGVATAPPFTADDTAGSYSVDAESDYGTVRLYLTNTAGGLPASIGVQGAAAQEASVNSRYAQPLQARVTDASGNPVQGAAVSFSIVPGVTGAGASFLGGQGAATTDSNGIATSPPLLANGSPGRFAATASTDGLSAVATYALDNHAASMTIETTATSDPTATVDSRYRTPLQARVLDASGQPVEGASVTFAIQPSAAGAGASFIGGAAQATETTDASGVATSPALLANKTAGTYSATATTAGGSRAATYALENRAAAPASITAGAASGESTPAGTRFPVRLAVTVVDKDGNPVAGATVVFSAPAHGPSGRFAVRKRTTIRIVRVRTNGEGIAVAPPFAAGATSGGYIVTAVVKGTSKRAAFALVNRPRA